MIKRVNVREFRKNLAKYLGTKIIVTKNGRDFSKINPVSGYYKNKQEKEALNG